MRAAVLYLALVLSGFTPARVAFEQAWLAVNQRPHVERNELLYAIAQAHASELCYREMVLDNLQGQTMHKDLQGRMPNERVRDGGYDLPATYADDENYLEDVAVTHLGPEYALKILVESESHHDHVVGKGWFREQEEYGIGVGCERYYVLLVAHKEEE